jgi:hypothetical protein
LIRRGDATTTPALRDHDGGDGDEPDGGESNRPADAFTGKRDCPDGDREQDGRQQPPSKVLLLLSPPPLDLGHPPTLVRKSVQIRRSRMRWRQHAT